MQQPVLRDVDDTDLTKDAVGGLRGEEDHGNSNAPALDEAGWPNHEIAIAEDVIGANEDETQG